MVAEIEGFKEWLKENMGDDGNIKSVKNYKQQRL